jgi:hypothetical protein
MALPLTTQEKTPAPNVSDDTILRAAGRRK